MSSKTIKKETIQGVTALTEATPGHGVVFPSGVQLATDTASNLEAASPGTVGMARIASDTGALYYADSDGKYHSCKTRGYAVDYDLSFETTPGSWATVEVTEGAAVRAHRAVYDSVKNGIKIPSGFGCVLFIVSWDIGKGASGSIDTISLRFGSTGPTYQFPENSFSLGGSTHSDCFVYDASGTIGRYAENMNFGPLVLESLLEGDMTPASWTGKLDVVAFGSEIWYQA